MRYLQVLTSLFMTRTRFKLPLSSTELSFRDTRAIMQRLRGLDLTLRMEFNASFKLYMRESNKSREWTKNKLIMDTEGTNLAAVEGMRQSVEYFIQKVQGADSLSEDDLQELNQLLKPSTLRLAWWRI